jgi:alpha-beta hydrolase superfamily lysophospholipase
MKKITGISLIAIAFISGYFFSRILNKPDKTINPINTKISERPLDKYSIENLSNSDIDPGEFVLTRKTTANEGFQSNIFRYSFHPDMSSTVKNTSGLINWPENKTSGEKFPIVILIRGYVDQKTYVSGTGTKNFASYLAKNGYITVAPDFLGYADSDSEAGDIFESRFQTYVTVISLIKAVEEGMIPGWDGKNIFIWGHSNGGQIAITTLEVTGKNYPTILWAPVSKPFPYSVLYYTDESDDNGKLIRSELSKFESLYEPENYSLTNYLEKISAPIAIHQGSADDAVPQAWSNVLVQKLKTLNKDVTYIIHYGADHNMNPDWNKAAKDSLDFFNSNLID